ncbi:hypothetical protein K445DRAFT_23719 [Daldinia sp. EC12]|nr:hypothetical protein K445DRAFT_23719 [Daldinia sp. EC12]
MVICDAESACKACHGSPESATTHEDCFLLFKQRYEAEDMFQRMLQRLWILVAWRIPWRRGPISAIDEENISIPDISAIGGYAFPMLRRLPPEIVQLIREYSPDSLLWRFGLALGLFQQLSTPASGDLVSMPLSDCLLWERDSLLAPTSCSASCSSPKPQFIRLTIDSFGIKRIERLLELSPYNPKRSERFLFVTIKESETKDVVVHFKFGTLRLEFPDASPGGFQIWDTETCPPPLGRCIFFWRQSIETAQFQTIDIRKITGITFFMAWNRVCQIHAHTAATPTAIQTWKQIPPMRRAVLTWIYLPISLNDDIIAFGPTIAARIRSMLTRFTLLFRLRLAGDVIVGPYQPNQHGPNGNAFFALTNQPVSTLVYGWPEPQNKYISTIGAVLNETPKPYQDDSLPSPQLKKPNLGFPYYSFASLWNVIRVIVYDNPDTGFCRGILLHYNNGAERALGQCRIGVDPAKIYDMPTYVCFIPQRYTRPNRPGQIKTAIVRCTNQDDHKHDEEGWVCTPMCHDLDFWFTQGQVDIWVD